MKETPYLDFYKKCMERGIMYDPYSGEDDSAGLCGQLGGRDLILFTPREHENEEFMDYGDSWCWGYDGTANPKRDGHTFTPLRQTIVLFLAAMNNEL